MTDAFLLIAFLAAATLLCTARPGRVRWAGQGLLVGIIMVALWEGAARADAPRVDRQAELGGWTRADSVFQLGVTGLLVADYLQTRQIIATARARPELAIGEGNPVMGRYGDRVPPVVYFAAVAGLSFGAARVLPQPWRRVAQLALSGVQIHSIHHNWTAGFAVTF